eukprot:NODE_2902_length_857_cov_214.016209.p1 GENE.NODE_2902_length_857_cov_214.016209~~NODE_2902_length_857_cov_214.016209.p1  ORF type:complete len:219 (+),score=43.49 NODE_2902_length_857_cov_214.016209:87-743(+)
MSLRNLEDQLTVGSAENRNQMLQLQEEIARIHESLFSINAEFVDHRRATNSVHSKLQSQVHSLEAGRRTPQPQHPASESPTPQQRHMAQHRASESPTPQQRHAAQQQQRQQQLHQLHGGAGKATGSHTPPPAPTYTVFHNPASGTMPPQGSSVSSSAPPWGSPYGYGTAPSPQLSAVRSMTPPVTPSAAGVPGLLPPSGLLAPQLPYPASMHAAWLPR